jgi:hypothetical protein
LEKNNLSNLPGISNSQKSKNEKLNQSDTESQNWVLTNESEPSILNKSSQRIELSPQNEIGLLLRLIDDFLYVTTSQEDSKNFILQMHKGFSSYGLSIK